MDTDLVGYAPDPHANLLPYDGIVNDYGVVLNLQKADACLHALLHDIAWQHDQVVIYGKRITTARQVACIAWLGRSDAKTPRHTSPAPGICRHDMECARQKLVAPPQKIEQASSNPAVTGLTQKAGTEDK